MEADYFIGVAQQALWILALASAPILIPVLVIGVLLGMVQAATSISILVLLTDFTRDLFAQIPNLVR